MENHLPNPFRSNSASEKHGSVGAENSALLRRDGQSINQVAAKGAALWRGPSQSAPRLYNQSNTRNAPIQNGHANRGTNAGHGGRGRGGQDRGRFPVSRGRGGGRGSVFQNGRFNGRTTNPSPGLFRPEPESHYCESCDMSFRNQEKLDEHLQNHVKCPKCDFLGVFDSIEEHFEMVHLTVLKNRLKPVETEEDLKQWRDERRQRYPKTENPLLAKYQKYGSAVNATALIKKAADLSDGEIEDEEMPESSSLIRTGANTLMNIFGCYGESGSDSEAPEELPCQKLSPVETPFTDHPSEIRDPEKPPDFFSQAPLDEMSIIQAGQPDTLSLEVSPCRFNTPDSPLTVDRKKETNLGSQLRPPVGLFASSTVRQRSHPGHPYHLPNRRKPRTLYEKLVAKDIERDNDRLVQCIAHIVSTNFLGTASTEAV